MSDESKMAEELGKLIVDEVRQLLGLVCKHSAWSRVYREVLVAALTSEGRGVGDALQVAGEAANAALVKYVEFEKQIQVKTKKIEDLAN